MVSIPHRRSFYRLPNPDSLPSDSSRSNSASWSLTSLGRADRSTPRSAIVASTAACGMFAMSRVTAGTDRHEAEGMKSGRSGVYSIFVTPRHRHDCRRWGGGAREVGGLTRGVCQSHDQGWWSAVWQRWWNHAGSVLHLSMISHSQQAKRGSYSGCLCRQPGSRQTVLGRKEPNRVNYKQKRINKCICFKHDIKIIFTLQPVDLGLVSVFQWGGSTGEGGICCTYKTPRHPKCHPTLPHFSLFGKWHEIKSNVRV